MQPKCCDIVSAMDKRVALQAPVPVRSGTGQSKNTWPDDTDVVWAAIEPLQGRDLWQAQQVQPLVSTKITIRYRSDVKGDWRVKYQGRVFNIVGLPIDPQMQHVWLVLNCIEGDGTKAG